MDKDNAVMLPDKNSGVWKLNLALLWISQILVLAGFCALIPFVPLFMKDVILKGVDVGGLAIYVSMFQFSGSFGYMFGNSLWGSLSDRFGTKIMLLRGTFSGGLLFPVMAYMSNVWIFIILRFFSAFLAGTTAASQIMIARMTPENRQGFAQGTLLTAYWGGSMLGNVIGGLVIHAYGYAAVFWVCGIMYIVAGIAILFTREDSISQIRMAKKAPLSVTQIREKLSPDEKKKSHSIIPSFSWIIWQMFFISFLSAYIRMVEVPFIALRVEELVPKGEAAYWTGIISACVCAGAIVAGVLAGYLSDRYRPTKIIPYVMVLTAIFLVWQGLADSLLAFGIARTMGYTIVGALSAFFQKTLISMTPKRRRGAVLGFSQSFSSAGTMVAAVFGGWVVFGFGLSGVFFFAAACFLILIPLYQKIFSTAEKTPFYESHSSAVRREKGKDAVSQEK